MNVKIKILIVLFFQLTLSLRAQNLDSLNAENLQYDSILSSDNEAMRTLFYKHQHDVLINNLGPYGSPFYYPTTYFLYRKEVFLKEDPINVKLFKLNGIKPFTNITYINASRKEQKFSIKHFQHFGKLMALNFDFKKISSPGAYTNQEANNTIFTGAFNYHTKKNTYEIKFSTGIYRYFYDENGGLYKTFDPNTGLFKAYDYENNLYDNERTYRVNLDNSNTFIKRYNNQLTQRLDLFKIGSDSSGKKVIYLKHQISYATKKRVFFDNDPLSEIYTTIYLDSLSSVDSVYNNNLSNTLFVGFRKDDFRFELLGQYDQKQYVQNDFMDRTYHSDFIGFESGLKKEAITVDMIAKFGLDGYNNGDMESEIKIDYDKAKYNINGHVNYFLTEPDLKYKNYNSNHFIWANENFKKQSLLDFYINFKLKKLKLEISAESKILNNTFYFDTLALASQDTNTASISTFSLAKDYRLLNFHFRTAMIYQITSDELLFPLPKIIGRQVLYYQKYIFKRALKFQFGIGISYSTDYNGYKYMPALNEFYIQAGKDKIGYYPSVDIFLNTHLKHAQVFLKWEHYNAGRSLHKSYSVPGYPPMPRSLKFGVSWNLFD